MSDHRLMVSDADIDIARLIVKLDRLDGRESDPTTLRVASAAAFEGGDESEYEVANDVAKPALLTPVNGTHVEAAAGVKPVRLRYLVRRRPRVRARISPAVRSLPAL